MRTGLIGIVAAALCLCSVSVAAARERGTPGSVARQAYCAGDYSDCIGAGRGDCKKTYTDSGQLEACFTGVVNACKNSFDTCLTAAIVKGGTAINPTSNTTRKAP